MLCSCCSDAPSPNTFGYEVFNKIPKKPKRERRYENQGYYPNNNKNYDQTNEKNVINNIPKESVKGSDSNLKELIKKQPEGVIKKVFKSNYNQLIKKHKKNDKGEKWTDPDFPPEQSSIGDVDDLPVRAGWKRIPQVVRNPEFVSGKIQPSDVLQGSIGDCYFLSSISALAQEDHRIKNLFPNLQINPHGIYMARILFQGVLRQVVVDDYIPVTPQNTPLFAKPAGGREIWVMILEKCWAKLHGSYGAIVGGLPNEVLHAFSGAPTFCRAISPNKQKQQKLWQDMINEDRDGSLLCCGTKADPSIQKAGLVLGHAYSVMGVYDKPYRMVKLRNPWGKRQWNGRASQEDRHFWSQISPADKQNLGYHEGNDGTFFMLWQDFVNYFGMVDICKINDNANYLCVQAQFDRHNGQMFEFETEGSSATVGLSQGSLRGASEEDQKKGYSRATIIVSKQEEAGKGYEYKYVNSSSGRNFSDHYMELPNLKAGKYVAFAKIDWIDKKIGEATFSLYSEGKSSLKKSTQSTHDKFLYKTFLDHARKNPKKQVLSQNPSEWVCSDFLLNKGGYGYLALHLDEKSKRKIGVELDEKQFNEKRFVLKKPYKDQGHIKTMVEPGKQLIILYRMKSQNYPATLTLPTPKIYNLV